jgi:peptide/nickel transport system substrate-binding protein
MNTRQKALILVSMLIIASMVLAACQPAAAPTAETIIETVIVTQIVEGEVQEVIITATPAPVEEVMPEGPIMADGLVPCLPLPELAFGEPAARSASIAQADIDSLVMRQAASLPAALQQQVTQEGEHVVGVFEDVTTTNFFSANGPGNTVWNAYMLPDKRTLYGQTMKYFTLVPDMAADPVPPALVEEGDFWVATIPMSQDVTWSDGEPLTAQDVAFTAQLRKDFNLIAGGWSTWYDNNYLDRIEAVDDYTVKLYFHTKGGLAVYEYGILQSPILAEHFWGPLVEEFRPGPDATAEEQAAAQEALFALDGTNEPNAGAWLLVSWEPGASLEVAANPDYSETGVVVEQWADGAYRDSTGLVVGEPSGDPEVVYTVGPFVEAVLYSIYGSQDTALLALRQGDVEIVLNPLGLQRGLAEQLKGDPNVTVAESPTNGIRYMGFNHRRMPMNDCSFRQAVAILIDKEFVTQTVLQGVAFPLYAFVPEANAAWFFGEAPQLGRGLTRQQRTELAIQILQNAGYTWEGDAIPTWDEEGRAVIPGGRLIMPNGVPVPPLTMPAPSAGYDPLRSTFAIWIETWLNEFGIPLQANLAGFNVIVPIIFSEQNFDMWMLGWSLTIFPDYVYDFFAEDQAVLEGNNAGGYVNPEFEELGQQIKTCEGIDVCKEIADQIQIMLGTEVPYVLLFDTGIIEAYREASIDLPWDEQLSGLQYSYNGGGMQAIVQLK